MFIGVFFISDCFQQNNVLLIGQTHILFQQDKWLQKNNGKPFATKYSFERPSPFLLYEKESRRKVQKKYPSKTRNKYGRTEVIKK